MNIIAAVDRNGGIGKNGKMPWHYPEDLRWFQRLTDGGTVIMGRRTFESLPIKPLSNRLNIVLSKSHAPGVDEKFEEVLWMREIPSSDLTNYFNLRKLWVIGGAGVYAQALASGRVEKIYLTRIPEDYQCDTFFPPIPEGEFGSPLSHLSYTPSQLTFQIYERIVQRQVEGGYPSVQGSSGVRTPD